MKNALKLSLIAATLISALAQAQTPTQSALPPDAPALSSTPQAGVNHMQAIMDGVAKGKLGGLDDATRAAIGTGLASAKVTADVDHMDARTVDFSVKQSEKMDQMAREAYVAALPPRDQALGRSVLLGDGTVSCLGCEQLFHREQSSRGWWIYLLVRIGSVLQERAGVQTASLNLQGVPTSTNPLLKLRGTRFSAATGAHFRHG